MEKHETEMNVLINSNKDHLEILLCMKGGKDKKLRNEE